MIVITRLLTDAVLVIARLQVSLPIRSGCHWLRSHNDIGFCGQSSRGVGCYIGSLTCVQAFRPLVFGDVVAFEVALQLDRYSIAVGDAHPVAKIVFDSRELLIAALTAALSDPLVRMGLPIKSRRNQCYCKICDETFNFCGPNFAAE